MDKQIKPRPFIKWAGGKGQLVESISKRYPKELGKRVNRYCEPFVGGGAVLFDVLTRYPLKDVLINDINPELINLYSQIRDCVDLLIKELGAIQRDYEILDSEDRKAYYYEKRELFNELTLRKNHLQDVKKASLFVFLNKTCFNGLYRVNKRGLFNVPAGDYKKPTICDRDNLLLVSELLRGVRISCADYRETSDFIDAKTLVYIDPPYRPLSLTSSFTAYNENVFDDAQQVELARFIDMISLRGAKVIASNSDPKNVNIQDNFFDEIYCAHNIQRISARRYINSNSAGRGAINELLITNI